MEWNRKKLINATALFCLGNLFLYCLLALRYLPSLPWLHSSYLLPHGRLVLELYLVFTYLGHFALLAFIPLICLTPLICIYPKRPLIFGMAFVMSTLLAAWLLTDSYIYTLYHFHLNGVIFNLWWSGMHEQFFDFSSLEKILCLLMALGLLLGEAFIAYLAWRKPNRIWVIPAIALGFCLYISYSFTLYSAGSPLARMLIESARVFPLYTETLGLFLPVKDGRQKIEEAFELSMVQPEQVSAPLRYPLEPLVFKPKAKALNLLIIVIDTWRYDMLNPEVTPTLAAFAKQSQVYNHHLSGGNATGPGIFSLFYGLPSTYWTAMQKNQRGPLLIDALMQQHYQMKILASAGLTLPAFNRTVFQAIPNLTLHLPGKDPYARDQQVTAGFKKFLKDERRAEQPFFAFLFYDSAHSYCAIRNNLKPFEPVTQVCNRLDLQSSSDPRPYLNRYKNALHLVDQEVQQDIAALKQQGLLENTVVLITGDHGEEFNDSHLGYWGHGSDFLPYQLQTPLLIAWPGEPAKTISSLTTHFELAPFLMRRLLGCQTAAKFYSVGEDALQASTLPLLVTSYVNLGILQKDRITTVFPSGHFEVSGVNGEPMPSAFLNAANLQQALDLTRLFYQPQT